jgi:uncharacterized protein YcaQ
VAGGLLSSAPAGATAAAGWQEEGLVVPVNVEALGEMWLHRDALAQLESAPGGKLAASHSAVLSPFDPVVWDRKRAEQLFNFSYRLECYPGAEASVWLFRTAAAAPGETGRANGQQNASQNRAGDLRPVAGGGVKITRGLEQGLRRAINDFARWQSADRILCRRLPEGLFVGQEQGGKLTLIEPFL